MTTISAVARYILVLCAFCMLPCISYAQEMPPELLEDPVPPPLQVVVYSDAKSPDNAFVADGEMGDESDLFAFAADVDYPKTGEHSFKVTYLPRSTDGNGWAGLYWLSPEGNWGMTAHGRDLSAFNKLVFYARGKTGREVIWRVLVGGVGREGKGKYPDTVAMEVGPFELDRDWQAYSVNLSGQNLSRVAGGFGVVFRAEVSSEPSVVYFDDVRFVHEPGLQPEKVKVSFPFYVYKDGSSALNRFTASGAMGDEAAISVDVHVQKGAMLGRSCVRVTYDAAKAGKEGWSGLYFQHPEDNWGELALGYDLSGARKLTFWARGETGKEKVDVFRVGGIAGQHPDSATTSVGPVKLGKDWKQYSVYVKGLKLNHIVGGFALTFTAEDNQAGATVYLDEIVYE